VDAEGSPVFFAPEAPLEAMTVEIPCAKGHAVLLRVPEDVSAEEALMTPDDAPIAQDATLKKN
jgi:hypothetical protein